jgi:hypothetical protein
VLALTQRGDDVYLIQRTQSRRFYGEGSSSAVLTQLKLSPASSEDPSMHLPPGKATTIKTP